jgi:carbon storage regulator
MLVLSRHPGETIQITGNGIDIKLMLVEIRGDKARIGIEAPRDITIMRSEIIEKYENQNIRTDPGRTESERDGT